VRYIMVYSRLLSIWHVPLFQLPELIMGNYILRSPPDLKGYRQLLR